MWKGCPLRKGKKYQAMADKARDSTWLQSKWRKDKNKKAEPKKAKKASKKSKVAVAVSVCEEPIVSLSSHAVISLIN